jgi:CTP:molybdopterin cytidylyltransferase MocA
VRLLLTGRAAVVLAAGRGVRFGGDLPKQLVALAGRPLGAYAIDAAIESGLGPVVVVVSDARVESALRGAGPVTFVRNEAPERGISSSLQTALRALEPDDGVDAAVVGLADQPLVGPEAYRRVARAYDDGARLAVAVYDGVRGNPVLIGREHWAEALELGGDEGARVLLRRYGAREVPCDGTGDPADVDTPDARAAVEARLAQRRLRKAPQENCPQEK